MGRPTGNSVINYLIPTIFMKQTVFFLFFFFLAISKTFAIDSLKINLVNQYKKHIKNATVKINNVDYKTDKAGQAVINNTGTDSVNILIEGYDIKTIAIKDIGPVNEIIVNKVKLA